MTVLLTAYGTHAPGLQIGPESLAQDRGLARTWTDLPADVQKGLQKTTETVAKQMKVYDARVQSVH